MDEAQWAGAFMFVVFVFKKIQIFFPVTGVNIHIVTPVVCLVCIFYTCVVSVKQIRGKFEAFFGRKLAIFLFRCVILFLCAGRSKGCRLD